MMNKPNFTGAFFLAPMAEVTHRPFRDLVHHWGGCDYYYSEMLSAKAFLSNGKYEKYYADPGPVPEKFIFQLVSGDAAAIVKAAEKLDSFSQGFGIDINMGCTAPEIYNDFGGVRWMESIPKARKLLASLRKTIKNKLFSIKIRTGIKDNMEELIRFVKMAEGEGVDFIVFHGRNKKDKLKRISKWAYLEAARDSISIPVVGNGDIKGFDDYSKKKIKYSPEGIMIGRGAVAKPWIFYFIREKEKKSDFSLNVQMDDLIYRFCHSLESQLPDEWLCSRTKRFLLYFHKNFFFGHELYKSVNHLRDYKKIKKNIHLFFKRFPEERNKIFN